MNAYPESFSFAPSDSQGELRLCKMARPRRPGASGIGLCPVFAPDRSLWKADFSVVKTRGQEVDAGKLVRRLQSEMENLQHVRRYFEYSF